VVVRCGSGARQGRGAEGVGEREQRTQDFSFSSGVDLTGGRKWNIYFWSVLAVVAVSDGEEVEAVGRWSD
jgi:hypothetical protein